MSTASVESTNKAPAILRSWTPTTTQQLQDASSYAFDVLDHVLESPYNLASELTPWMPQLKPARTQGDVQVAEIMSLLPGIQAVPATSRGDCSMFIGRDVRQQADFNTKFPVLSHLIATVQDSAQHYLSQSIALDPTLTSVQLAIYPGDGTSGYPKHCDRSKTLSKTGMQRIVTAVYYVTPLDWSADLDGGALRVFCGGTEYYDVVPYANRMVVFRSDTVDHQVMPSQRRERMALTIWLYGKVREDNVVRTRNLLTHRYGNAPVATTQESNDMATLPPPLPVTDAGEENSTMFVSIAAYRDSELGPTLRSLFATAQHPARVFVGIVLQLDDTSDESIWNGLPHHQEWFTTNVKILSLQARHARGPCYARHLCQQLHAGEDYVLQIDSHMRFRPNWDSYLIEQLVKCPSPKSMLTAYPVGYTLPNEIPNETRGTILVPWKFDADGMLRQRGRLLQPRDSSVTCHLYAAGFNFAPASMLADVPYDGKLQYLFFGEELSMAVRLYTHGYNLYAPPETVCYHLWSRSHRPTPTGETVSPETKLQQESQRHAARQVVLQQIQGEGRGLGTERTAAEFAEAINVDFTEQTINENAGLGGLDAHEFVNDASSFSPDSLEGKVASLDVKTQACIMSFLSELNT